MRTASNRAQSDRTNNGDSYNCRDCKIHHAAGMRTPAGLAQIKARYAHRDSAPRPERVCYGCGKPGHYIADCPDPHKTELAIPTDEARKAENHQIEAEIKANANERYEYNASQARKRTREDRERAEQMLQKQQKLKESMEKHDW